MTWSKLQDDSAITSYALDPRKYNDELFWKKLSEFSIPEDQVLEAAEAVPQAYWTVISFQGKETTFPDLKLFLAQVYKRLPSCKIDFEKALKDSALPGFEHITDMATKAADIRYTLSKNTNPIDFTTLNNFIAVLGFVIVALAFTALSLPSLILGIVSLAVGAVAAGLYAYELKEVRRTGELEGLAAGMEEISQGPVFGM